VGPQQRPFSWHSRAGGGAVHSIESGHVQRSYRCPLWANSGHRSSPTARLQTAVSLALSLVAWTLPTALPARSAARFICAFDQLGLRARSASSSYSGFLAGLYGIADGDIGQQDSSRPSF
jgi:hypothetical protein